MAKQSNLQKQLGSDFQASFDSLRELRDTWDDKETLLLGKRADRISDTLRSQITDGHLATLQWDRAARVMAQLPTGVIQAISKKDKGKNALMNIILNRYIIPNSNSQYPHLIKLRIADVYSRAWGAVPILYDYRVDDEYIGPDFWVLNIRDFFPQPGKLTIQDCDWVMVSTIVTVGWLKEKAKRDGWNAKEIKEVIEQAKENGTPSKKKDHNRVGERSQLIDSVEKNKGDNAEIELITKYERGEDGEWITFAPDFENRVIRQIKNPHSSGRIPVILKQNFPRIDSIVGLSDVERGETLQKAKDSLINLYMEGVKMSIFPPLKINPTGVRMSSVKNQAGSKWLMDDPSKVVQHQVSPQGINTFVGTYQFLHSALLNQAGTTDTTVSSNQGATDQGKTPAAIKQQMARENARDNWDRFMMEKTVEELYEGMINLLSEKQEKPIPIDLFEDEVEQIMAAGMEDVAEIYESGKAGKITIAKKDIKSKYRYMIDAGSTMAKDDEEELNALMNILQLTISIPGLQEVLQQKGKNVNLDELYKRILIKSGIQDWEKILSEVDEEAQDYNSYVDQYSQQVNDLVQQTLGGVNVQQR